MQKRILALSVSTLVMSLCAFADTTQWNITNGTTGDYSYAGGSSDLIGSDIGVENIVGSPTPINSGSPNELAIVGGTLDFTSGANTGGWTWGGAPGSLTVTGCIAALGLGTIVSGNCVSAATLVSDDFTSVSITALPVSGSPLGVEFGYLEGTMNAAIASYFGISPAFTSPASTGADALFGLPSSGPGDAFGAGTSSTVTSTAPGGNLSLVAAAVPEGWNLVSTLGMFGLGLATFGLAGRFGLVKAIQF